MTSPDTKAIRAQMDALAGFTAGPWRTDAGTANSHCYEDQIVADYGDNTGVAFSDAVDAGLIAAAPDMRETILALCDALDELRADMATCTAKRDEWVDRAMTELGNVLDLRAENERLQTIIGNLHAVEEKHRETANTHFHRANRLKVENERLRAALYDVIGCDHHNFYDGVPPKYVRIARAALAQNEGK